MTLIGYPQVSAIDQDPEAQAAALGVPRIDNLRASALAFSIAAIRSESACPITPLQHFKIFHSA
jgi:hypothetical protein